MRTNKIILAALFALAAIVSAFPANCTHDGPEESFLYRYIKRDGVSSPNNYIATYEAYYEYVQNWSRVASQPYGSLHVHMTPAGVTNFSGLSDSTGIDVYSAGAYDDAHCTDEVDINRYNGTDSTTHHYNPSTPDPNSKLIWPGTDNGGEGYQLDYTNVVLSDNSERNSGNQSETKRFRVGGAPSFTSAVTFVVVAYVFNPATGADGSAISNTSIMVNNVSCDANGHVTLSFVADNAWHDLSVTATGQSNIHYSIGYVSNTNPG